MRLAQASAEAEKPDTMDFDCECRFEYHMSSHANDEAGHV